MRTLVLWLLLLAPALVGPALADPRLQRGRLVGPDGAWLADREVRLVTYEVEPREALGRTDADGRFAIDVAPLGTSLGVLLVVGPRRWGPACSEQYLDQPDWGTLRVPRLPVLAGRVVDAKGAPLARVGVAWDWARESDVFTDEQGRFELEVPVGAQQLRLDRAGTDWLVETPGLRLVEGQGRVTLDLVVDPARRDGLDPTRLARLERSGHELRGLRLERVGGDPAWGPPWDQEQVAWASDRPVLPGEYRVHQLEGSAMAGPGEHPFRTWTATLRPGPNVLVPPADARLAIPCLVELDQVPEPRTEPEPGPEPSWLVGWSHPQAPPPLDEAGFRTWPLHELGDRSNMRYDGELIELAGVNSDTRAREEAEAAAAEARAEAGVEEPAVEERPEEELVAHLPGPGRWGLTLSVGQAHCGLQVEVAPGTRWTTTRARWSPAGGATLALVPPRREGLVYPQHALYPLHAVLVDERDVVRWARPLLQHRPLEVRGLAPGRYRLLWAYSGFRPREAKVELAAGRTAKVVLEPF